MAWERPESVTLLITAPLKSGTSENCVNPRDNTTVTCGNVTMCPNWVI